MPPHDIEYRNQLLRGSGASPEAAFLDAEQCSLFNVVVHAVTAADDYHYSRIWPLSPPLHATHNARLLSSSLFLPPGDRCDMRIRATARYLGFTISDTQRKSAENATRPNSNAHDYSTHLRHIIIIITASHPRRLYRSLHVCLFPAHFRAVTARPRYVIATRRASPCCERSPRHAQIPQRVRSAKTVTTFLFLDEKKRRQPLAAARGQCYRIEIVPNTSRTDALPHYLCYHSFPRSAQSPSY